MGTTSIPQLRAHLQVLGDRCLQPSHPDHKHTATASPFARGDGNAAVGMGATFLSGGLPPGAEGSAGVVGVDRYVAFGT